jgi:hypothetical protein
MQSSDLDENDSQRFTPRPIAQQWLPGVVEIEVEPGITLPIFGTEEVPPPVVPLLNAFSGQLIAIDRPFRDNSAEYEPVSARRRLYRLRFAGDGDLGSLANVLQATPGIVRASPVPDPLPPLVPPDPLLGTSAAFSEDPATHLPRQWYIFACLADQAWTNHNVSGAGVVIADIDWGLRVTHEDLAPSIELQNAFNAVDGSHDVSAGSFLFHGTGVAGFAVASSNGVGITGFAPGAKLWPVQGNSGNNAPLAGDPWANAIDFVRKQPGNGRRKVLLLEVQSGALRNIEQNAAVNDAIKTAIADDLVVCVAAGNGDFDVSLDDRGNPIPPTGSILVAATRRVDTTNRRLESSNWGSRIVVSAPGQVSEDVTCYTPHDDSYCGTFGGTSGAAPKVAGTIALMLEANDALTHYQVRTILSTLTTKPLAGKKKPIGTFLNAEEAVVAALRLARPQIHLFARDLDGGLRHRFTDGTDWTEGISLGPAGGRTAVARRRDGLLDLLTADEGGLLRRRRQTAADSWGPWRTLRVRAEGMSMATNPRGELSLFLCDANEPLLHVIQYRGATIVKETRPLPEPGMMEVAGSWNASGSLEMFVGSRSGVVWHLQDDRTAIPALQAEGEIDRYGMQMATAPDGRLSLFVCGPDGILKTKTQEAAFGGNWTDWNSFDGTFRRFAVRRDRDGRLVLVAIRDDGTIVSSRQGRLNRRWSEWNSVGKNASTTSLVRARDGRLHLFVTRSDHSVWRTSEDVPGGSWVDWISLGLVNADSLAVIACG